MVFNEKEEGFIDKSLAKMEKNRYHGNIQYELLMR
jgi:hypothetical protein